MWIKDAANVTLKLLDETGTVNVGGKSQSVYDFVKEENPKIKPKIDYLVGDTDVKSAQAMKELHKSKLPVSHIIKILSAGLLGIKKNRILVPTRWAITAVDSNISKKVPESKFLPL